MLANISRTELRLLHYLLERTGASGGRIALDPKAIMRGLRINATQLAADSAALAAHGFAGVRHSRSGPENVPVEACSAVWVTSKGEAYLKRAQSAPGAAGSSGI
jgi:hypothetical protein